MAGSYSEFPSHPIKTPAKRERFYWVGRNAIYGQLLPTGPSADVPLLPFLIVKSMAKLAAKRE